MAPTLCKDIEKGFDPKRACQDLGLCLSKFKCEDDDIFMTTHTHTHGRMYSSMQACMHTRIHTHTSVHSCQVRNVNLLVLGQV